MPALLNEPQVAERVIKELQSKSRSAGAGAGVDGKVKRLLRFRAETDRASERSREEVREAHVEESKMDGLKSAAVLIRTTLDNAQKHLNEGATLIVLDDFYHVPYGAQPDVLAYLHQIVKNLGIYLKVCGVRHRIQAFVEDDPPRGLQPGQDAREVSLDITLERFRTAQTFLESILTGICDPLDKLRERLTDIVKFSLDVNKTNVLLVEGPVLQEEEWGKEIQALADLRLLHEIGNLSDKRGTYRGRRFVGFTLDLSNYTGTRSEQITQIEFWTREGKQAARNANLIYTPGASERDPKKKAEKPNADEQAVLDSSDWGEQTDIYSLLPDEESTHGGEPAGEPS
jgi:hypothetical protein